MNFLDPKEFEEWKRVHSIALPEGRSIYLDRGRHILCCKSPKDIARQYWFARFIEDELRPRKECLLSVEEWGTWPSAENWHLYYSLCKLFGESRQISDVRVIRFLENESDELTTFLQICIAMGWDFVALTENDANRVFVSHDEWTCFSKSSEAAFEKSCRDAKEGGLEIIEAHVRT